LSSKFKRSISLTREKFPKKLGKKKGEKGRGVSSPKWSLKEGAWVPSWASVIEDVTKQELKPGMMR